MPLPADTRDPWPPRSWRLLQSDVDEAAAWYSGDGDQLSRFYGGTTSDGEPPRDVRDRVRFWRRQAQQQVRKRERVHVPVAGDVAATSADLLFGEAPKLLVPEANGERAEAGAVAAQDRLLQMSEDIGLENTLLEGAEVCAGLGGCYLRVAWDTDVARHPLLSIVHADRAVPEFVWGQLRAVTFWRVVHDDNGQVWRHLERHEPGVILHGLYAGTRDNLGVRRPLDAHPSTAGLDEIVPLPEGIDGLVVRYVPNVLPNRRRRGQPVGRADTSGNESLMDALDQTYTSWMRDIRLGQARIIVPHEFLERTWGRGGGATFNVDQELFTGLDMDPASRDAAGIEQVEFKIRTDDHAKTAYELFGRIVAGAGYAPQTFGLDADGRAESGTALRIREGKSLRTRARKQRYWTPAAEEILELMLAVDRAVFGTRVDVFRPRLELADGIVNDPSELASTVDMLARARAASIETRVRMVNPDLEDAEVAAEVERIKAEESIAVPDPTGGLA